MQAEEDVADGLRLKAPLSGGALDPTPNAMHFRATAYELLQDHASVLLYGRAAAVGAGLRVQLLFIT